MRVRINCQWKIIFCLGLLTARLATAADLGKIEINDAAGGVRKPFAEAGQKATVLLFVTPDCPISNRYAPEVNRIVADYTPQKISCYLVYVDEDLPAADARKHRRAFGYTCPALLDSRHELVAVAKVTVTPEVAVFSPDGKLLYHGRIDDRYADIGKPRAEAGQHDLRDVLTAVLDGKPVPNPVTRAVGCFIPALR